MQKKAFTLVEILIAIGIIGIVAAITLPTLFTNINNFVKEINLKIINKKLEQGVTITNNLESAFSGRIYNNSYEFVGLLSKHFKLSSTCDEQNLKNCIPYKKISFEKPNNTLNYIDVTDLNLEELNLSSDTHYEPAGFITGSGIPYIIALKKDCVIDPDSINKNVDNPIRCIDGLYDYNGAKGPNKYGKDIVSLGDGGISQAAYIAKFGNVYIANQLMNISLAEAQAAASYCKDIKNNGSFKDTNGTFGKKDKDIKISSNPLLFCSSRTTDYWLAAKIKCESKGLKLPNNEELAQIAKVAYDIEGEVTPILNKSYPGKRLEISKYGLYVEYANEDKTFFFISEDKPEVWMYYVWKFNQHNLPWGQATSLSKEQTSIYNNTMYAACVLK